MKDPDFATWLGQKVVKTSGKPFKSGLKTNTVRSITFGYANKPGFKFEEDDSIVEAFRCELVGEQNERTSEINNE